MTTKTNNIIRQMRHRLHMSQSQFAELVGRSQARISELEREVVSPPSLATITDIADTCGISVAYLPDGWRILPADFNLPPPA